MSSLYLVKTQGRRLWVAWEDVEAAQIYAWVQNTGRFHRNRGLEADFYWDQELEFEPVTREEAWNLIRAGVGRMDGRKKSAQLAGYRLDEGARSAAEVLGEDGVVEVPSARRRADAKARVIAAAPAGRWVVWKTYPKSRRQAAYVAATDLKSGKIRALEVIDGGVDARVVKAAGGLLEVQVSRLSTSSQQA